MRCGLLSCILPDYIQTSAQITAIGALRLLRPVLLTETSISLIRLHRCVGQVEAHYKECHIAGYFLYFFNKYFTIERQAIWSR